jgi:hypothetical protein
MEWWLLESSGGENWVDIDESIIQKRESVQENITRVTIVNNNNNILYSWKL